MPTVLLVNDDPTQLAVVAGLLGKDGFEVRSYSSGEEALEACRAFQPDVVVSDLHMPGISGDQLLGLLRSADFPAFHQIPIILVSASPPSPELEERCQSLLAGRGALLAPYRLPELRRTARSYLPQAASQESSPPESEPQLAPSGPFDPLPLDKLLQTGGPALARRIAELFTTKTPAYLEQARQALVQADHSLIERLAHSIKGSAGMVGALEVQRQAGLLEQAAAAGQGQASMIEGLEVAFQVCHDWLASRLA